MKSILRVSVALAGLLPSQAFAQEASIGSRLQAMLSDLTGPLVFLVSITCLLAGLWLLARSLIRLKDAGGNNEQTGPALLTMVAAVMLVALPEVAGIGMLTTAGGGFVSNGDMMAARATLDAGYADKSAGLSGTIAGLAEVKAPENCLTDKDQAVTCMAKNLAQNVVPIGIITVFAAAFIAGLWGLGSAMLDLTKTQGGRGVPDGFWSKVIFNVLLMNGPFFFGIMTRTIFGHQGTINESGGLDTSGGLLEYDMGIEAETLAKYQELIGYAFIILALFGAVALVRGLFVLKAAGEGKQSATMGHGIVFIIAGALLANAKASTCVILTTVGAGGITSGASALGFC
jgi:hypothetical protein